MQGPQIGLSVGHLYWKVCFLGAIGGAIAGIATWQFYRYITVEVISNFAFMPLVPMMPFIYQLSVGLVVVGILVGAIGSTISLKQYMKVQE